MKKILLISVRSDFGGGPKHVNDLFINLSAKYSIFIAAPLENPYGSRWEKELKEHFFQIPHRKFNLKSLLSLIKYIRKNKIEIIHSHGKGAGVYSRMIKIALPHIRVVHTFHGFTTKQYSSRINKIYYCYEYILSKLTDNFIFNSDGEKQTFISKIQCARQKMRVIYNGIEKKTFASKESIKRKLNIPQNKFVVVTVSRYDYQKNMQACFNIAERLVNEEILFLWIGNGEDKKYFDERIKAENINNIRCVDFTKDVLEYISVSDIYLTTSRWEGLPYALIEALMLGIPIIGSNVIGNNEIIENGYNGFLFELNNLSEAIEKIRLLSGDKKLLSEFSCNSTKAFEKSFTIRKMIDEIINIYEEDSIAQR